MASKNKKKGKDPAFLFYPNDWIGGTMGMTFEEKGAYMELLMMQFNRGHMTSHMIGQTVGQLWDKVKDKFVQDENGLYYNARLDEEKEKRKSYTESRYNNKTGKNQYTKKEGSYVGHMTYHMEDANENENENINVVSLKGMQGETLKSESEKAPDLKKEPEIPTDDFSNLDKAHKILRGKMEISQEFQKRYKWTEKQYVEKVDEFVEFCRRKGKNHNYAGLLQHFRNTMNKNAQFSLMHKKLAVIPPSPDEDFTEEAIARQLQEFRDRTAMQESEIPVEEQIRMIQESYKM